MRRALSQLIRTSKKSLPVTSKPYNPVVKPRMSSTMTSTLSTSSLSSSSPFLSAIKTRRTNYQLTDKSTIPDSEVEKIVAEAIKHVPSAFNVQSARAVVLFGEHHRNLWQIGAKHMKNIMPAEIFASFEPKMKGLESAHGTVLFFEDQEVLDQLAEKNPMVSAEVPDWSKNSAGMHHFAVWTALSLEGLGASLQHYNMVPPFAKEVNETWSLPESWKLNAQLVFGTPTAPAAERTYLPVEPRMKVFA